MDWKLTDVLPKAGGTLDQDPLFMSEFRFILNVESSLTEQKKGMEEIKAEIKKKTGRK